MKALCVNSPNNLVVEERPIPEIKNASDVLIKVKAGGICGSDVHFYHGTSSVTTYPRVIGHEIVGEIIAKGDTVINLSVGDRVIIDPVINCGKCYQCRIGCIRRISWVIFPGPWGELEKNSFADTSSACPKGITLWRPGSSFFFMNSNSSADC